MQGKEHEGAAERTHVTLRDAGGQVVLLAEWGCLEM